MSCPKCRNGLPSNVDRCPDCGAMNAAFDSTVTTQPGGRPPDPVTQTLGAAGMVEVSDVLGFLVLYSESSEGPGEGPDPLLGRVVPMRPGDVFFVGKAPLPAEVASRENAKAVPSAHHLFPFTEAYSHISRRHLVIQMEPDGKTYLTDVSTNGIYLKSAGKHLRRGKENFSVHAVTGPETVILGLDMSSTGDPRVKEKASRFQIQIVPVGGPGGRPA